MGIQQSDFLFLMLAAVTSFLMAFLILPVLIKYSLKKNLVVVPGRRMMHKKVTPSLGGIAIFIGFMIASLVWIDFSEWMTQRYLIASLFIIFFLGVRDDLVPFNAWRKLIGQAAAILVLMFSEVKINSLYGLLAVDSLPVVASLILTAGFIIIVTNAYNLIDGLDGLAGTVGMIAFTGYGIWFHLTDQPFYALLCFAMVGGLLAFLIFNWQPAEIFMGDTGAMVAGMLLSIVTIRFMNSNEALPVGHVAKFGSSIGAAACMIVLPLCDTVRIIMLRIARGQSPITPDKSHIHHGLVRLGLTHAKAALLLGVICLGFVGLVLLTKSLSNWMVIGLVVGLCAGLSITLDRLLIGRVTNRELPDEGEA
jgi:UDP-GlcNAc:undecaprenyl-phosphate/decaprenyl-phosphate GlcNAc-1-phosphate transferase